MSLLISISVIVMGLLYARRTDLDCHLAGEMRLPSRRGRESLRVTTMNGETGSALCLSVSGGSSGSLFELSCNTHHISVSLDE